MLRLTIVFIVTGHAGRCVNSYTLITGRDTEDVTFVATPHDLLCFLSSLFWSGWHQTFDSVQFKRDRLTHHVSHFYLAWILMTLGTTYYSSDNKIAEGQSRTSFTTVLCYVEKSRSADVSVAAATGVVEVNVQI